MERQKLPVSSGASVRTPHPSLPGLFPPLPLVPVIPADAPPLFNSDLFFLSPSLPSHIPLPSNTLLVLPSLFLLPAAVGIQMRLEFLQRMFWAATQQVGALVAGLGRGQRTRQQSCSEEGLPLSDLLSQPPHCLLGHLLGPLSALLVTLLLCRSLLPVPLPVASVSGPSLPYPVLSFSLDLGQRARHSVPFGPGLSFAMSLLP